MSALLPLALCWLCGPVFLLLDGRRQAVAWAGVAVLAAVTALDLILLFDVAWYGRVPLSEVTGGWPIGVGIRLYVDAVSLFFGAVCGFVLTAVMAHEAMGRVRSGPLPALILFMCAGLHGAFFTGDLFNFYVFFELSVVSSFAMASYGFGREEVRGAFVYIVANLLGSVLFLAGIAVVYHTAGMLDLAELRSRAGGTGHGIHHLAAALLFAALSLKVGLFPLHGWVPVLYSHSRPVIGAALGGALINIGAYGLLRIGFVSADAALADAAPLLLTLGAVTIVYGAVLASRRETPSEMIAYASIAQAGYIVIALGAGGQAGAAAVLFVVLSGSIEKAAMFLSQQGWARPVSAFVGAAGMAGLPLTLGFLAKIELIRAALLAPFGLLVALAIALGTGFLFVTAVRFWREVRSGTWADDRDGGPLAAGLAGTTVALALMAAPLGELIVGLAEDLAPGDG